MSSSIKERIQHDVKQSMRARDKERVGVLRMVSAEIKQREIDSQSQLDDEGVLLVLDKMVKQRRDAQSQFRAAERTDLADQEAYEIDVISCYLPQPLDGEEIAQLIDEAIEASGAQSMKEMGKVMAALKPKVQGRADMAGVSKAVKSRLTGS